MAMLLGGRTAEELVFGEITTGASDDIEKVHRDRPGDGHPVRHERQRSARSSSARSRARCSSAATWATRPTTPTRSPAQIDAEVRHLIDAAHDRGPGDPRRTHRATLDVLAEALVEKETLEDAELAEIFGPLDKGTGIAEPEPEPADVPVPVDPSSVRRHGRRGAAGRATRRGARPRPSGQAALVATRRRPSPEAQRYVVRDPHERPPIDTPMDLARIEKAVREILEAIGEDPDRDGLRAHARAGRPHVRRDLRRAPRGPDRAPHRHLRGRPRRDGHGARHPAVLALRAPPHPVHRQGPRRLHPGDDGRITGLSKLARLVDGYASGPQVQERLTVADRRRDRAEPSSPGA